MRTRRSRVAEAASRAVCRIRVAVANPVATTAATNTAVAITSTVMFRWAMPWSMPICTSAGPACSRVVSTSTASTEVIR